MSATLQWWLDNFFICVYPVHLRFYPTAGLPLEDRTEVLDYFADGGDGFPTKSKLKLELRTIG